MDDIAKMFTYYADKIAPATNLATAALEAADSVLALKDIIQ